MQKQPKCPWTDEWTKKKWSIYTMEYHSALFTKAKTCKQPKCPLTDEWIKKMWSIYTMEYHSAITKVGIMPFAATWMGLEVMEMGVHPG